MIMLISGHRDVTSERKMKLPNISEINTDDLVVLSVVMGFSKVVHIDLVSRVNFRNKNAFQ